MAVECLSKVIHVFNSGATFKAFCQESRVSDRVKQGDGHEMMVSWLTEVDGVEHGRGGVAVPGKAMDDTDEARSMSIMPFDTAYVPKLSIMKANTLADEYSPEMPPFPISFYRSMRAPSLYRGFSFL